MNINGVDATQRRVTRLAACLTIMVGSGLGAQSVGVGAKRPGADEDQKRALEAGDILLRADTFHVYRRPDGTCVWARRPWRNPGPGTSSYLAEVRNKDCFGVIHNVRRPPRPDSATQAVARVDTTRRASAPSKPYGIPLRDDDYLMSPSEYTVEMEAFTVPRAATGRCDWDKAQTRRTQKPIEESSTHGERHERTCQGVMYFYAIPKQYQVGGPGLRPGPGRSVSVWFPPSVWEGPDTLTGRGREVRDMVNLVLPHLPGKARVNQVSIENETTAYVRVVTQDALGTMYRLDKKDGRWVLSPNVIKSR
jgi:hypothetical protein